MIDMLSVQKSSANFLLSENKQLWLGMQTLDLNLNPIDFSI